MPTREQLMRELAEAPDHLLEQLLDFLRAARRSDEQAHADAMALSAALKKPPSRRGAPDSPTWSDIALDDLVAQRGVPVCHDLTVLVGQWPPEDSVDELLALVREVRQ